MIDGKQIMRAIMKMVEPVSRNVKLIVGRCVLEALDDSTGLQTARVSLLAGEVQELERIQNFGFVGHPTPGAEGVCLFVGGNREHGICIALEDRDLRPNVEAGESMQYGVLGNKIHCKQDGGILVETPLGAKVEIDATGNIVVNGLSITLGEGGSEPVLNGQTFQTKYNTHTHTVFGIPTTTVVVPSVPLDLSAVVSAGKVPSL